MTQTNIQQKIMEARFAIQSFDPIIGVYAARYKIIPAKGVHKFSVNEEGVELIYDEKWVESTASETITAEIFAYFVNNPTNDDVREAAKKYQTEKQKRVSFPVKEVLNGTFTNVGFDETKEWAAILLGMVMAELERRDVALGREPGWTTSVARTAWLEDADNFLLFLLNNYPDDTILMAVRHTVSEAKLRFDTQRMQHFVSMATRMASYLSETR